MAQDAAPAAPCCLALGRHRRAASVRRAQTATGAKPEGSRAGEGQPGPSGGCAHLLRLGVQGKLDVALAHDAQVLHHLHGCAPQHEVLGVVKGLAGRHHDGLARVDPQRVQVLHVAHLAAAGGACVSPQAAGVPTAPRAARACSQLLLPQAGPSWLPSPPPLPWGPTGAPLHSQGLSTSPQNTPCVAAPPEHGGCGGSGSRGTAPGSRAGTTGGAGDPSLGTGSSSSPRPHAPSTRSSINSPPAGLGG